MAVPEKNKTSSNDSYSKKEGEGPPPTKPVTRVLLMISILLAVFTVGIDRTIVATAAPSISNAFSSPNDIGWYGSGYLLTACAFQPTWGRAYTHFDTKLAFIISLAVFELGSLVCGAAPNSPVFIVGRAIAGSGCAGVLAGAFALISNVVPLQQRPIFISFVGATMGMSAVAGPIIGGVFTALTTWRWCFYVNLPVGGAVLIPLIMFLRPPPSIYEEPALQRLLRLDFIGTGILLCGTTMLLLALQWGGTALPWDSGVVIGCLIGSGVAASVFIAWLVHRGEDGLVPVQLLKQRTVIASVGSAVTVSGALLVHLYYLPYFFQAVRGDTALQAAVHITPYILANYGAATATSFVVSHTGYFNPPAILGPMIGAVGSGLLSLLSPTTSMTQVVVLQIVAAVGYGMAVQQPLIAPQAVLSKELAAMSTTLVLFVQSLAGAVFVSASNSMLQNALLSGLRRLPGDLDVPRIVAAGATQLRELVPANGLAGALGVYSEALQRVFIIPIPLACLGALAGLAMEWKTIKRTKATTDTKEQLSSDAESGEV